MPEGRLIARTPMKQMRLAFVASVAADVPSAVLLLAWAWKRMHSTEMTAAA